MPAAILLRLVEQVLGCNDAKQVQFAYGKGVNALAFKCDFYRNDAPILILQLHLCSWRG